nr:Hint domain-containing protein [Deinobacterium chartae]
MFASFYVKERSDDQPRPKPVGHEDLSDHWVGAGHLEVDDERITATPEHPFYVTERSDSEPRPKPEGHPDLSDKWVGAGHLKVGDKLKQADGTLGEVRYVNTIQEARTMYNLSVEEAHTFFVGTQGWLVHNCNGEALANTANAALKQLPKDLRGVTIAVAKDANGKPILAVYGRTDEMTKDAIEVLKGKGWNVEPAPPRGAEFHAERQLDALGYETIGISRQQGMCS